MNALHSCVLACGVLTGCAGLAKTDEPTPARLELGEAVVIWDAPTTRADQSCLDELAGFVIHWGASPDQLESRERVPLSKVECEATGRETPCGEVKRCSYTLSDLPHEILYFAVRAYDQTSQVSDSSEVVKRSVPPDR